RPKAESPGSIAPVGGLWIPGSLATLGPRNDGKAGGEDMDRRQFVIGSTALAAGTLAAPAIVRAATEISFYYPVAVGGPITKIIDGYAADFEKENPGISVK